MALCELRHVRGDIHESISNHRIDDEDILHAIDHAVADPVSPNGMRTAVSSDRAHGWT
jgi:hypothetical protein